MPRSSKPRLYIPKATGLPQWRRPRTMRPALESLSIAPLLRDPVAFLQVLCTWEGERIHLDGWQVAFLRRQHRFRAFEKSVQIGFSWICAAEAFHRAFVYEDDQSSFVSLSENEAKNKVHYVQALHEGLESWLREMVPVPTDSKEEIWFGSTGRASIIRSLPASASLRGRATHVYLDELDHFRPGVDRETFTAAIGRVTRSRRRLTIGSSVFGEETMLGEIMRKGEASGYPDFLKAQLPWWVSENDGVIESVTLAQRNMPVEDFAQEYECARSVIADSMFPQDFIRTHQHVEELESYESLPESGSYAAGFDPGATIHPAVLTIFRESGKWEQVVLTQLRNKSLTEQQRLLERLLTRCQGMTLAIDPGGIGKQMATDLEDGFGARVQQVNFTAHTKYDMAVNMRTMLERNDAAICRSRDLAHQMNRTRRLAGSKLDQPSMGKRTHYDEFWATALALHAAQGDAISVYDTHGLMVIDMEDGSLLSPVVETAA